MIMARENCLRFPGNSGQGGLFNRGLPLAETDVVPEKRRSLLLRWNEHRL